MRFYQEDKKMSKEFMMNSSMNFPGQSVPGHWEISANLKTE